MKLRALVVGGAFLSSCLVFGVGAAPAQADETVLSVEVVAPGVDPAHLRAAVARELALVAVAPADPRAASARGELTVTARPADATLTVTFRKPNAFPVTRTVPLPRGGATEIESTAVILAGNVARDQTSELLAGLRPRRDAATKRPRTPTPAEVDGLATMTRSVSAYEHGARAYRETLTEIVRLHYETKKQAILSGLDREISVEKRELERSRATAIRRLEEFLVAHPNEPDAMYRLAALYDERGVEGEGDQAIALYKRIVREHPTYRERTAVLYYLGHALADAGRLPESQQVWRSLVCANRYPYPVAVDPRDSKRDLVAPLPQDGERSGRYLEVYPADCAGGDAKYVAEVWWQIGNWEFDQLDFGAGPWAYARAASAYQRAMALGRPPIYGVSLYKYAWTLYKQQRYEAATKAFVDLLAYTDEEERRTGDRGADFRSEAFTYIAGSLTSFDFRGPPVSAPYAPPAEDVDEAKLTLAVDRLKDSRIVPQDKPWTIEIYRAVAAELRALGALGHALAVYDTMLARWPLDPSAPETDAAIAETYDQVAGLRPSGTKEARDAEQRGLDARTRLARYVGATPWVDANKDHPAALQTAERLARTGLRHAAATHTNQARAALDAAHAMAGQSRARRDLLERAAAEYRLAATGWSGVVAQAVDDTPDTYEGRYWNADARHKSVRLALLLGREPSAVEIDEAIAAAVLVRDSQLDDRFLDNAAFFLVDVADARLEIARAHGLARRDEVTFDGDDVRTRHVVRQAIPQAVVDTLAARDAYVAFVPAERAPLRRTPGYRYAVADTYFVYGEWDVARERFEAIWREQCGVDAAGAKAWERLLTMATTSRDEARALALLDAVDPKKGGRSCDAAAERRYDGPVRTAALYDQAQKKLDEATAADPKDRSKRLAAARLFEAAGTASPEALVRAAGVYASAGEAGHAIALYERVIAEHGSELVHAALLAKAYESLAATRAAAFDYAATADVSARTARARVLDEKTRREAALRAIVLSTSLGDRGAALAMRGELATLHPSARELAEADFRVATEADLPRFYETYRGRGVAQALLVEAAHAVGRAKRARGDATGATMWLARAVAAWDDLRARDPREAQRAPYVDHAAEAAYLLLDDEIAAKRTGRGTGTALDVLAKFKANAAVATAFDLRLEREVIRKFESPAWVAVAIARQGALFDALRSGLYDITRPLLFTPREEALLTKLRANGQGERADAIEDTARERWRERKQIELDGADEVMIRRYAAAVALARRYDVSAPAVGRALLRLAYYTDVIGDAKLGTWVARTNDPADPSGHTKLAYRERMYDQARPGSGAPPSAATPPVLVPIVP